MPKMPEIDPAATAIKAHQAARLRRLRQIVQPNQTDAASIGGLSISAWNRMEKGVSSLDAVAVARWCSRHDFGADYILTGRLASLPDDLIRLVAQVEHMDMQAAKGGREAPADTMALVGSEPVGTSPGRNTPGRPKIPALG